MKVALESANKNLSQKQIVTYIACFPKKPDRRCSPVYIFS